MGFESTTFYTLVGEGAVTIELRRDVLLVGYCCAYICVVV